MRSVATWRALGRASRQVAARPPAVAGWRARRAVASAGHRDGPGHRQP